MYFICGSNVQNNDSHHTHLISCQLTCLPRRLCVLLALISFFLFLKWFLGDQLSKDLLDRFLSHVHQMVRIWPLIIDLTLFFRSLKGIAMATNFTDKIGKIGLFTFILRSHISKRIRLLQCRWAAMATSCENFVNFGPVTPEFTTVVGMHPSSISTGVSLATFAWRRHCSHQY